MIGVILVASCAPEDIEICAVSGASSNLFHRLHQMRVMQSLAFQHILLQPKLIGFLSTLSFKDYCKIFHAHKRSRMIHP